MQTSRLLAEIEVGVDLPYYTAQPEGLGHIAGISNETIYNGVHERGDFKQGGSRDSGGESKKVEQKAAKETKGRVRLEA